MFSITEIDDLKFFFVAYQVKFNFSGYQILR